MTQSLASPSTWIANKSLRQTLAYYALFICLGLGMGVSGPTLPSLAAQTSTTIGNMGLMFLISSFGYISGTALGGRLFDRLRGHPILGLSQLVVAGLVIFLPLTPWFWLLLVIVFLQGTAGGIINTGANTLLVWTHKEKVAPFMNALHFCFGLGAFLSPFLVAQVIEIEGGYRWVYWILAGFDLLAALFMLSQKESPAPTPPTDQDAKSAAGNVRQHLPLVISAMLFLFFYVGAEIAFGSWIFTYATTLKLASDTDAAYLTSGFWLAFTIGRLISIPAAARFAPKQILTISLLACLIVLSLLFFIPNSLSVLWIVVLGLGFSMAPIWPTGFTFAGQSIALTAQLTSIILLGDSLGGMVLPSALGKVIETVGPPAMVTLVFISLVLNLLAFLFMVRLKPARA